MEEEANWDFDTMIFIPTLCTVVFATVVAFESGMNTINDIRHVMSRRLYLFATTMAFLLGLVVYGIVIDLALSACAFIDLNTVQFFFGTLLLLGGVSAAYTSTARHETLALVAQRDTSNDKEIDLYRFGSHINARALSYFRLAFSIFSFQYFSTSCLIVALGAMTGTSKISLAGIFVSGLAIIALPSFASSNTYHEKRRKCRAVISIFMMSFGTFNVGEGMGLAWPLGSTSLLFLLALYSLVALMARVSTKTIRLPRGEAS